MAIFDNKNEEELFERAKLPPRSAFDRGTGMEIPPIGTPPFVTTGGFTQTQLPVLGTPPPAIGAAASTLLGAPKPTTLPVARDTLPEMGQPSGVGGIPPWQRAVGGAQEGLLQQGLQADRDRIRKEFAPSTLPTEQPAGTLPKSMPSLTDGLSEADRQTIAAMGGGPDAEKLVREARQEFNVKEASSLSGARAIRDSLLKQGMSKEDIQIAYGDRDAMRKKAKELEAGGMSREKILKEIGTIPKSREENFRRLSRFQKERERLKADGGKLERRDARLENRALKSANAAEVQGLKDAFDERGPNPEGGNILSYATKSDKKRIESTIDAASQGHVNKSVIRNLNRILEKTRKAAAADFEKAKWDNETEKRDADIERISQNVTSSKDKAQMDKNKAKYKQLNDDYDLLIAKSESKKVDKKDKPTPEEIEAARTDIRDFQLDKGLSISDRTGGKTEAQIIQSFMKVNDGMTEEAAREAAIGAGYIQEN